MKMKKTDIGVVAFMYAVCAFFYAYSGKLTAEQSAALVGRISFTSRLEDLADTDFLVEAILEKLEVKHDFYRQLCAVVAEDAILCSNTSGLSITKIAEAVTHPERFAGMHWMNPPHIIPLIEIVEGEQTAPETAELVRQVALGMKKKPVIVKDAPSFVLNRLQQAILRESLHIVQQGIASPEAVDDVMKYALGFRYACFGPFETCDLGGLDIHHNIAKYTFADLCTATEPFGLISECIEHDRLGVKNGAGELVVNSIDTDGVKNGFDLELLDAVAQRCAVPIIASGGAGKMEDFKELFLNHPRVDAGLAASIFHTKQVDLRDLKLYLRENGVEMRV